MARVRSQFDHTVTIGTLRSLFANGRDGLQAQAGMPRRDAT
jgi:hypothetical protein